MKMFGAPFLIAIFCMIASTIAHAQQDGARGFMLAPEGVRGLVAMTNISSANQAPNYDVVIPGSQVTSVVSLAEYSQPFSLAGNWAAIVVGQPFGTLSGEVTVASQTISNTSSGAGDFLFGAMLGVIGMPSLPMESYVTYKPGFSLAAVAFAMAPTGAYDETQIFNLGTNRWAFRIALPMSYTLAESFIDPQLMTFELKPAINFYTANDAPFGADRLTQNPFFELEGHITRNLNSTIWVSGDAIYQYGGETFTDGVSADNARMNFQLGATVGITLSPSLQLRVSYAQAVARNDYGLDGQGVRLMLVSGF